MIPGGFSLAHPSNEADQASGGVQLVPGTEYVGRTGYFRGNLHIADASKFWEGSKYLVLVEQ